MSMNKFTIIISLTISQLIPFSTTAQDIWKGYEKLFQPIRNYVAYRTPSEITIDGLAGEPSWDQAAWSDEFADIEGAHMPAPKYRTKMKMLWDNSFLYIMAQMEEPHIWAYYKVHDQIVYHENDFEVFIDPEGDGRDYFEFEVNAANTLFDLLLPKPYRNGGDALISWEAKGFKSAVAIDGTLNNPNDTDKRWTVEMAIPFETLRAKTPADNQTWKINFSRVEWQHVVADGKYQKKKDEKTGRDLREDNWVWSPTGEINMHVPERWGILQFSTRIVNQKKVDFRMPETEAYKKLLWLVYYKQHDFEALHGHFTSLLSDLNLPDQMNITPGKPVRLALKATANQFTIQLMTENKIRFTIDEDGLLKTGEHNY